MTDWRPTDWLVEIGWQRTVGPNGKIPPKMGFKKFVKLTCYIYDCNSLTNFKFEAHPITGNGSWVNFLKFAWKNSWNLTKWTYIWGGLAIWNHYATKARMNKDYAKKPLTQVICCSDCSLIKCSFPVILIFTKNIVNVLSGLHQKTLSFFKASRIWIWNFFKKYRKSLIFMYWGSHNLR